MTKFSYKMKNNKRLLFKKNQMLFLNVIFKAIYMKKLGLNVDIFEIFNYNTFSEL